MFPAAVAQYLETNGGIVDYRPDAVGANVFVDQPMPEAPDIAIAITSVPGSAPDFKFAYDYPSFQARVRGEAGDPRPAEQKAKDIYNALQGLVNVQMGAYRVIKLESAQSGPGFLGNDENGRPEYVVNFEAEVRGLVGNRQ